MWQSRIILFAAIVAAFVISFIPPKETPAQLPVESEAKALGTEFKSLVVENKQKIDSSIEIMQNLKVVKPIVPVKTYNYWLNRLIGKIQRERRAIEREAAQPEPQVIIIEKENPQTIYGGTPQREPTEREKNDGRALRGFGNWIKKIFGKQ